MGTQTSDPLAKSTCSVRVVELSIPRKVQLCSACDSHDTLCCENHTNTFANHKMMEVITAQICTGWLINDGWLMLTRVCNDY